MAEENDTLFGDWTDGLTEAAAEIAVAPERAFRFELEVVGAMRVRRNLCRCPVVADAADVAGIFAPAVACSRQEDTCAIFLAGELTTIDTIVCRPLIGAVVDHFFNLVKGGQAPRTTPFHMNHIVLRA